MNADAHQATATDALLKAKLVGQQESMKSKLGEAKAFVKAFAKVTGK